MTLLFLNMSADEQLISLMTLPNLLRDAARASWLLSGHLSAENSLLNGTPLRLSEEGELPSLSPAQETASEELLLPAMTVNSIQFEASVPLCQSTGKP